MVADVAVGAGTLNIEVFEWLPTWPVKEDRSKRDGGVGWPRLICNRATARLISMVTFGEVLSNRMSVGILPHGTST